VIDGSVIEVDVLEEEGLAHSVVSQVPEVFGGKSHLIDAPEARVALADDVRSTSCILCLPMTGPHLPLAPLDIFGIDACDQSHDPMAYQSHRLIHSYPSCHLFQALIVLG